MRSLLPVPLEGKGTREIEALPSYLARLAAAHGVTIGGLFRHLLDDYEGGVAVGGALGAQPLAASSRPNATAERTIKVLARGGCESEQGLRHATFLHLTPALARSPGTYSRHLRWCPGCLHEQSVERDTAYLKLCWFLEDLRACDRHHIVLRDTCPHCARRPATGRWWPSFSVCPRCEDPLDIVHSSDQLEHDTEAYAPDLLDLAAEIATRTGAFPAGAVNRYGGQVLAKAWASERESELWKKLTRDECLRYSVSDEPITL